MTIINPKVAGFESKERLRSSEIKEDGIVESMANMNGVWDDNFIQKFTTYSFKSIIESMANVNGVWDDNFIQKFTTYSFESANQDKNNSQKRLLDLLLSLDLYTWSVYCLKIYLY